MNQDSVINYYYYDQHGITTASDVSVQDCLKLDLSEKRLWIDLVGIHDKTKVQELADAYAIHHLAVEDILNTEQRAKIEDYGSFQYVVMRMFCLIGGVESDQQVSFIVLDNTIISFREKNFGVFDPVVARLNNDQSNLRKRGEDYLLYRLMDTIIDNYLIVLEHVNTQLEELDKNILRKPSDSHLVHLQKLKGDVLYIRKSLLPVRDLVSYLMRNDISFFDGENKYYLRDLQDHMTRNVEELDFQRDQLNSLMDLYYSLQQYKMNNVMKTLTGVSFVLLPLTFIASLYGMNFSVIPRSEDPWGFYEVLLGMAAIASVLTWFAFRRNWLSSRDFNKDR